MAKPKHSNEGSDGKLIDTWHYEYQGLTEKLDADNPDGELHRFVEPKKVAIELRLIKHFTGDTPPLAVKQVEFLLVCKDPEIRLRGNGIENLRAAMWEKLDAKFKVEWHEYYLVEIDHSSSYQGISTGLTFSYRTVQKGIAWDGTLLLREYKTYRGEIIEPWPGEFKDKRGRVIACIPASKANRKALEEFQRRVDALRDRLADFLRPDSIQHTLANLNVNNLLPAPEGETEE